MTRRGRVRLWLLLAFIPFAVGAIWLGVKLMSLQTVTADAMQDFDEGDYTTSEQKFGGLAGDSLVESWIPYFDRGDAKVGAQDLTAAIDDFEKALSLAPLDRQCMVGLNLASAWEALGDSYEQSGSHDGAVQLYENAKRVLARLGDACAKSGQTPQLDAQGERVQAKEDAAQDNADLEQQGVPDGGDKLDQLGQKQGQSDQDKQNDETRGRSPSSPGGVDKPW